MSDTREVSWFIWVERRFYVCTLLRYSSNIPCKTLSFATRFATFAYENKNFILPTISSGCVPVFVAKSSIKQYAPISVQWIRKRNLFISFLLPSYAPYNRYGRLPFFFYRDFGYLGGFGGGGLRRRECDSAKNHARKIRITMRAGNGFARGFCPGQQLHELTLAVDEKKHICLLEILDFFYYIFFFCVCGANGNHERSGAVYFFSTCYDKLPSSLSLGWSDGIWGRKKWQILSPSKT